MKSIWKSEVELSKRSELKGSLQVENVVIGAGMAGVLIAWFLQKQGREVVVVDADEIGGGQTGNTTAKITSQHGLCYDKMINKIGKKQAYLYALANENAIHMFEKIIKEEKIECHFEKKPAYLYTVTDDNVAKLRKEMNAARMIGIDAVWIEGERISELPFKIKAAVGFPNQAQFHPLEFLKHLSNQLVVYEHTKVLSVKNKTVYMENAQIKACNIIFATHYPITNIPGFYFLRQHQERSYVVALSNQKSLNGMYYSIDEGGLSLRSAGDYLLLGGGGHRTGKCICRQKKGELLGYSFLKNKVKLYYPEAEIAYSWSAQDCMPHDDVPFIGRYSLFQKNRYVATGFKKWGMTSSMIAAEIISNQICKNRCEKNNIFSPQRLYFCAGIKNLLIDMWESVSGLTKGLVGPSQKRCTHLGCKLDWNPEESSWECSCHGSSYHKNGGLKDNPAKYNLKQKR